MFKAKKTIMYIDVKGVDDMTDRRDLMREVIRRNCDVDSRIIDSLVDKLGSCGDKDHKVRVFIESNQKVMYVNTDEYKNAKNARSACVRTQIFMKTI